MEKTLKNDDKLFMAKVKVFGLVSATKGYM